MKIRSFVPAAFAALAMGFMVASCGQQSELCPNGRVPRLTDKSGGYFCLRNAGGGACDTGDDCVTGVCTNNVCVAPNAADMAAPPADQATPPSDMASQPDMVAPPVPTFCNDGIRDGDETDVDCGGALCRPANRCGAGKQCVVDADCVDGNCNDGYCGGRPAGMFCSNTGECLPGLTCGASTWTCGYADGVPCSGNNLCASGFCSAAGLCAELPSSPDLGTPPPADMATPSADLGTPPADMVASSADQATPPSDIASPPSDLAPSGCTSNATCPIGFVCASGVCVAPTAMNACHDSSSGIVLPIAAHCCDGVKDFDETGYDCGGPSCNLYYKCPPGMGCAVNADCNAVVFAGLQCNAVGGAPGTCGCATGVTLCGAACVNLQTDNANCGACAAKCATGTACQSGACK